MTQFIYNDGGRAAAWHEDKKNFAGNAPGDCVARAVAIATGKPYAEVWRRLANINLIEGKKESANHGVHTRHKLFINYMGELGLSWVAITEVIKFKDVVFPAGRVVVSMRGHYTTLIDRVINDAFNPTPAGKALVYGYWVFKTALYNVVHVSNGVTTQLNRAPLNKEQAETMQHLMRLNYKKNTLLHAI